MKSFIRKIFINIFCLPWKLLSKFGFYSGKGFAIQFVTENANWAIQSVGKQIKKELDKKNPNYYELTSNPSRLAKQIVHFGSQYMWLNWGQFMSKDNYFITSFFHGKPSDGVEVEMHIEKFLQSMPRLNKVITSSSLVENRLLEWGVERDKLVKIPLGVDTRNFKKASINKKKLIREKYQIPSNALVIGSFQKDGIGWGDGLKPKYIKGPDILVESIKDLCTNGVPVFVVLTGPARGYVKKRLNDYNIPFLHLFVSNMYDLIPLYQVLDIYLISSREEGGPMGLLESIACGATVVTTNVGMAMDVVSDNINGFIVKDFSSESIADKIKKFTEMPSEKKLDIEEKARINILNFDWKVVAKMHWEQVYMPAYNSIKKNL